MGAGTSASWEIPGLSLITTPAAVTTLTQLTVSFW